MLESQPDLKETTCSFLKAQEKSKAHLVACSLWTEQELRELLPEETFVSDQNFKACILPLEEVHVVPNEENHNELNIFQKKIEQQLMQLCNCAINILKLPISL